MSMHACHRSAARAAIVAAIAFMSFTQAQSAPASAPAAAAAQAPIEPEKQKLIERILTLYHPEEAVLLMVQHPASDAIEKSNIALQGRVSKEKQEATMKEIVVDVQKYVDTTMPIAKASAKKNVVPAVAPLLAQNFSVEELRQIVAMLESPVKEKFEKFVPQMQAAVGQKVGADITTEVNKDIVTMNKAVGAKLAAAVK